MAPDAHAVRVVRKPRAENGVCLGSQRCAVSEFRVTSHSPTRVRRVHIQDRQQRSRTTHAPSGSARYAHFLGAFQLSELFGFHDETATRLGRAPSASGRARAGLRTTATAATTTAQHRRSNGQPKVGPSPTTSKLATVRHQAGNQDTQAPITADAAATLPPPAQLHSPSSSSPPAAAAYATEAHSNQSQRIQEPAPGGARAEAPARRGQGGCGDRGCALHRPPAQDPHREVRPLRNSGLSQR